MNHKHLIAIALCASTLLTTLPLAAGSSAHPELHTFSGVNNVFATSSLNGDTLAGAAFANMPVCTTPVSPSTNPPGIVTTDDPSVGIGGGCFPYVTHFGDDTGATVTVVVNELTLTPIGIHPVYVACVDVNGDGFCVEADHPNGKLRPFDDRVALCVERQSQGWLYESPTEPCSIEMYAGPGNSVHVLDQTLYVNLVAGLDSDTGQLTRYGPATRGSIRLF